MNDLMDVDPEAAVEGSPEDVQPDESGTPTTTAPDGSASVEELLSQADERFTAADEALKAGKLAEYQRLIEKARGLVNQAAEVMGTPSSTTSSTTTTTTAADTAD